MYQGQTVQTAAIKPSGDEGLIQRLGPATHALLRIAAALLFMQHGAQKLFGWFGGFGEPGATAPLISQMGLAGVLELFGGLLILFGFLTRPMAIILVGEMVAAYVIAHLPQGGMPIENQGELALLFAAIFAFLFGNGAGPMSIDSWMADRRRDQAEARDHAAPVTQVDRPRPKKNAAA